MKNLLKISAFVNVMLLCVCGQVAQAHFQVFIPSSDIVVAEGSRRADFTIEFTHPMEQGPVMNMSEPAQFGVLLMGEKKDLKDTIYKITTSSKDYTNDLVNYLDGRISGLILKTIVKGNDD